MANRKRATSDEWRASPAGGAPVAAGVCILGLMLVANLLRLETAPSPFVWSDIAGVTLLCALPLAGLIAASIGRTRWPAALALAFASLLLGAALAGPIPAAGRGLLAFGLSLAGVLALQAFMPGFTSRHADQPRKTGAAWSLAIAAFVGLPWLYVEARCRHDESKLAGLMEQSRVGESLALARRLAMLKPSAKVRGFPVDQVIRESERVVAELSSRVAVPLPDGASESERLARAQDLAILGRTAEALGVLASPASLRGSAAANILRGTIHEARGEFAAALAAYEAAKQVTGPAGDERTDWLIATRGIAYSHRKLGRYAEAAAAYQELLAQDPTAETHFLLARFYEDAQQATAAQHHARQAMALEPQRYSTEGQQLIDQLITRQFGCWGAFKQERGP